MMCGVEGVWEWTEDRSGTQRVGMRQRKRDVMKYADMRVLMSADEAVGRQSHRCGHSKLS